MVPSKQSEEHIPFNDLPNANDVNITGGITNITVGESITSDDIPISEDFRQRRRQRDRERYAEMSIQQKDKLLKKRHENYQRKKTATTNIGAEHNHLLDLTDEQIETRRAKDRARYANMTPKQRQAIRDRQNARNRKPEQKQAKKDQYKARRKLRRNTLYKDSIAMVNPFYDSMDDSS